jgi:hypothetical protein
MGFVLPFHQQQHFSFHFKERNMNQDAFNKGLKTRREVLGAEYVDTAIKNADDFNMPMQELVTEYCWNEIWNHATNDSLIYLFSLPQNLRVF